MGSPRNVTVIGAGMACAGALRRDGHAVTVVDSRPPGEGCSRGNAGHISPGSCLPLAMPGIVREIPGWLFDPLGPLAIRWRYLPRAAPRGGGRPPGPSFAHVLLRLFDPSPKISGVLSADPD